MTKLTSPSFPLGIPPLKQKISRLGLPIPKAPNSPKGFVAVPAPERFADRYFMEPNSGCWLWLGSLSSCGYAFFRSECGQSGHRFSYIHFRGPVPDGMVLDHKCRTRSRVNPWHLEAVTTQENIRRGRVGENNRARTHCPKGHSYDEENTRHTRAGRRACRACARIWAAAATKRAQNANS